LHIIAIAGVGFDVPWESDALAKRQAMAVTVALQPTQDVRDAEHEASADQEGAQAVAEVAKSQQLLAAGSTVPAARSAAGVGDEREEQQDVDPAMPTVIPALSDSVLTDNEALALVAARRSAEAEYIRVWRTRVEEVGNRLYAKVTEAYGEGDVRLAVSISRTGHVLDITVLDSSGHAGLERAAQTMVRAAAPFAPLPSTLTQELDVLDIVRTWQFRHQGSPQRSPQNIKSG
jgi:protein TonB